MSKRPRTMETKCRIVKLTSEWAMSAVGGRGPGRRDGTEGEQGEDESDALHRVASWCLTS